MSDEAKMIIHEDADGTECAEPLPYVPKAQSRSIAADARRAALLECEEMAKREAENNDAAAGNLINAREVVFKAQANALRALAARFRQMAEESAP